MPVILACFWPNVACSARTCDARLRRTVGSGLGSGASALPIASITCINTGILTGLPLALSGSYLADTRAGRTIHGRHDQGGHATRCPASREPARPASGSMLIMCCKHSIAARDRAVLRLYRNTRDTAQPMQPTCGPHCVPLDLPALVIWGAHDPYIARGVRRASATGFPTRRSDHPARQRSLAVCRRSGCGRRSARAVPAPTATAPLKRAPTSCHFCDGFRCRHGSDSPTGDGNSQRLLNRQPHA